jgi:hypothetical protein
MKGGLIVTAAAVSATLAATLAESTVRGDEGMWLPNALPLKRLADKYGFTPDEKWAEHVRKASVRFNSGGSGSFVSADGLVMTNHHVGADAIQKLSTAEKDLYKNGFYAKTREEELKTPDLEVNVLWSIEDVTDKVNAAVKPEMSPADAFAARRKAMADIEKASLDETKLRSDVVTLYQGGAYHLYRYRKFTDVRLVFAPEFAAAFFGGDPDNFEYPRYDLDCAFFRVYEDGKPFKPPFHFAWSKAGAAEGELCFVSGHPGRTNRQNTVAQLRYQRDFSLPNSLNLLRRREVLLQQFAGRSPENARIAQEDLFGIQNSRKALTGKLGGLLDPDLFAAKVEAEKKLRAAVEADPAKKVKYAEAWAAVEEAQKVLRHELYPSYGLLERGAAFNSELFHIARTLVRLAEEKGKPNGERLREYRESALSSLELQLYSPAPIYPELEKVKLADSLAMMAELLGGEHPLVIETLKGMSPAARAAQLIDGSKLGDVEVRKKVAEGGKDAIARSQDPLIALAKAVDAEARKLRKVYEDKVEGVERSAFDKIAKARFELLGTDTYPDATFTLRLAYGVVKGYTEFGRTVPPFTTLGGAFEREKEMGAKDPFKLPPSWHAAKDKVDAATPFNFVLTADIIGGNSGSPVINRKAEIVGLIFDGNIQSLVWDYSFTDVQGRAVAVDSRGIVEALRKIYGAAGLAKELAGE